MSSSTINLEENLTVRDWYEESQGYYGSTATNMVCYDNGTNIRGPYALPSCTVSNIRIKVDPSDTGIYVRGCIYKKVNGVATAILMGVGSWKQLSSSGAQVVDCPCSIFLPNSGNYYIGWSSSGVVCAISWLGYPSWDGKTSYFRNGYPNPFGTPGFTDSTITFVARVTYRVPIPPTFTWTRVQNLDEDLDLQDSFWEVDPFLQENFERFDLDYNSWTVQGTTPQFNQTIFHHGGVSLRTWSNANARAGIKYSFAPKASIALRAFIYSENIPYDTNNMNFIELMWDNGSESYMRYGPDSVAEVGYPRHELHVGGLEWIFTPEFETGRWYLVELLLWNQGGHVYTKLYIDKQLWATSDQVGTVYVDAIRIHGDFTSGSGSTYYIDVDDIALGTMKLGSNLDPDENLMGRYRTETLDLNGEITNPRWKYLLEDLVFERVERFPYPTPSEMWWNVYSNFQFVGPFTMPKNGIITKVLAKLKNAEAATSNLFRSAIYLQIDGLTTLTKIGGTSEEISLSPGVRTDAEFDFKDDPPSLNKDDVFWIMVGHSYYSYFSFCWELRNTGVQHGYKKLITYPNFPAVTGSGWSEIAPQWAPYTFLAGYVVKEGGDYLTRFVTKRLFLSLVLNILLIKRFVRFLAENGMITKTEVNMEG